MATVQKSDSESFTLSEATSFPEDSIKGSSEKWSLTELEYVDDGTFGFTAPFTQSVIDSHYTASYVGETLELVEMLLWTDSQYPLISVNLYDPDGTLMDLTERTITFDVTTPGSYITRPCTIDGNDVSFSWNAGIAPGSYQGRFTVRGTDFRLSVPTLPVIVRISDQP